MIQDTLVKRRFGHRARLALSAAGGHAAGDQEHAAGTLWNLLHARWRMTPKEKRTRSARGTIEEPGKNAARTSGLSRSLSGAARDRTATAPACQTAQLGGTLVKLPTPGTSRRCSACGSTTPGGRAPLAALVCANADCGWSGSAGHSAARSVLHRYRMGLALVPVAGRAFVWRTKRVRTAAAR